ncbi:hypothetical protein T07_14760 [Trichinella nelsoni]|uniref:Uncharacterized protein n=1 Tax=Trichinella nelsoni TaxID=6336 RepID=A0A0V0S2C6_9BILA|nr:hypothetical protein T07_14760 [Trichinella nelsoni]
MFHFGPNSFFFSEPRFFGYNSRQQQLAHLLLNVERGAEEKRNKMQVECHHIHGRNEKRARHFRSRFQEDRPCPGLMDRDHARNIGEVYETYTCSNNVATLGPRKCVVFQTLLNDEAISAGDWQLIFGAVCVDEKRLLSLNTLVQVIAMPISNPNSAPS